ncbi:hypothetical protein B0F90DRAFT_433143 [Multifurca ochricompacta]|uniref:Uncharacterized protein n=1 Tax=Multifurca ochricompacta TaxID=376703 RepID=A0AAD4M407_9AGAM|nr:hypothetical protein B0F90DRAFT_433143 [Multifurca ochricompacta]
MTTSRRRSNHGERRHHASPEPERPSTSRRVPVADPPTPSVTASRPIDLEEFQQGPFRATLERLERRELQEQQIIIERQAEIDRLRSRLDELQSLERSVTSSRVPTLPPLRFDRELVASDSPHRLSSPTPPAITDTLSFRPDSEATHRRRSWQRGRGTRPSWLHHSEEPVPWRSSSGLPPSSAPLPIPRTHSPPRPLYESRNTRPTPERERERRRRPEILELWGPEDVDDSLDSLVASPLGDGSFFTRNLARIRGELPSTDVQQPRREPHSSSPWNLDPGRPTSREPHADALRGIRPLWATHALGPWGTEVRRKSSVQVQMQEHLRILLLVGVAASPAYLRMGVMYLRMNGLLQGVGRHLHHAMRQPAERSVIHCSNAFKGWSEAVRERAVFSVGMADGIPGTLS